MSYSAQEDSPPQQNKKYKILQEYKNDLVSHLAAIKLVDLSSKLRKSLVISQKVHDVIHMLDDTLDPEIRLRYLVQCVCGGVKEDDTVFNRFLNVLAQYGGIAKQLTSHICEKLKGCDRMTGPEDLAVAHGTGSSQTLGGEIYLVEENVTDLMDILVEESDKWEELGIALHLPRHARCNCRGSSIYISMANILCEWISRNQPENNTLKRLQLALASKLVGRYCVAETLERKFRDSQKPCEVIPVAKLPELVYPLSIVCQSCNTIVADGRSTLLEVQLSISDGVDYQWKEGGKSLTDDLIYSGMHTTILLISPASQATQGNYTCHITKGSEKVIISDVILLTVSFPPEKKHLIKLYSKNSEVPLDSWPPEVTDTFINLALIIKKKKITDDYNYSIRRDIDDILETKEKIDYERVFRKFRSGALIVVEGRPGSGKTTLVHKVTRDWATGEKVLMNAKLVFLIPLRRLSSRNTGKLSDILELLYHDKEECENVVSEIKQCNGEGMCFILDGLDEFHPQAENKSVIYQLLYEKYLPAAMIIVASRPVATDKLRRESHVKSRIEVLGFSHQHILDYIDNYPFTLNVTNSASAPSRLKAYLNSHHNLLHMCYLPVHAAMICFLYEHKRGDIPHTETEIYMHFTIFIVLRNLKRSNEKAELDSLEDLHGKEKEYFSKICQLAFHMTTNSTQTVCQRDIPLSLSTGSDDVPMLGLVTVDRTTELHRLHRTYAFLHLTFQEYLTAHYLAKIREAEQIEMIRVYAGKKHMQMVWKFYFGIVNFGNKVAQVEYIIMSTGMKSKDTNLYAAQCAFESQQQVVCDSIVKERTGVLNYHKCSITLTDISAVGYVISTTSHPVAELNMDWCSLGDHHVRILLQNYSTNKQNTILTLSFNDNNIGTEGAYALAAGVKSCNCLQTLHLTNNYIGAEGASALAGGLLSCNSLQTLHLSNNNIGAEGAYALARVFQSCNKLQTVYLDKNNIGNEGVCALASGLKSCNILQSLHLSNNDIGTEGASALAYVLKSSSNLQTLHISNNNICAEGACALAGGLKYCNNLQELWLSNNKVEVKGACALADELKCCYNLQELQLYNNNIGAKGACALAGWFKSCNNLQSLYLHNNNIGCEGASSLAGGLKSCNNLQTLYLYNNNIGDEGASSLVDVLKCFNNLQSVYLRNNNIGAEARATLLQLKCRNLQL